MKIAIFGTGYVGLVSAVCLAEKSNIVYCIDKDRQKIEMLKRGESPIYEPGLEILLKKNRDKIFPTDEARDTIRKSDVIIIAVGTPFDGQNIDLSFIRQAAIKIGKSMKDSKKYQTVVVKSTVIPGTTENLVMPLILKYSQKSKEHIGFCMNPEFLREGKAIEDFNNPDRIVLGVTSPKCERQMRKLYSKFGSAEIVLTNPTSAEMIKYTANSFLALSISFSNEIARICETLRGVDSEIVFHGVVLDKRISPIKDGVRIVPEITTYLKAGCGFGGSCFPKDVKALASFEKQSNVDGALLSGLMYINDTQIEHVFNMGIKRCRKNVSRIAVLGTAFKPDTDDIRESPGIKIIQHALNNNIKVNVHDYIALENTRKKFNDQVETFEDPLDAVKNSDIVFITTSWGKYFKISDSDFKANLKRGAIVVDTRSIYKKRAEKNWRIRIGVGK